MGYGVESAFLLRNRRGALRREAFETGNHGGQTGFAGAQPNVLHQEAHEIGRKCQCYGRWLVVDGREGDREYCGHGRRLPGVNVGVEMNRAVVQPFGKDINPGLAFGHGKRRSIETRQPFRQWFELFGPPQQRLHLVVSLQQAELLKGAGQRRRQRFLGRRRVGKGWRGGVGHAGMQCCRGRPVKRVRCDAYLSS